MSETIRLDPPIPVTIEPHFRKNARQLGAAGNSPQGPALAYAWVDLGIDHDLIWRVCFDGSGQWWDIPNPFVRGVKNITMGRVGETVGVEAKTIRPSAVVRWVRKSVGQAVSSLVISGTDWIQIAALNSIPLARNGSKKMSDDPPRPASYYLRQADVLSPHKPGNVERRERFLRVVRIKAWAPKPRPSEIKPVVI